MATARTERVDRPGGPLEVHRWPGPGPTVFAVHGITTNGLSFGRLAAALADRADLVALDLRGRAGSAAAGPPYGIARHAEDGWAVLDALDVPRAVLLGHSMGGFVAAAMACAAPERTERLVCVDGGWAMPAPADADLDAVLAAVLGPALQRLSLSFASAAAYRDYWAGHPAFAGQLDDAVTAYLDHDLVDTPTGLRASTPLAAVRVDGADVFGRTAVQQALAGVTVPAVLLLAERGMTDGPEPLYPDAAVAGLRAARPDLPAYRVGGTNHYTVVLADSGTAAVAAAALGEPLLGYARPVPGAASDPAAAPPGPSAPGVR